MLTRSSNDKGNYNGRLQSQKCECSNLLERMSKQIIFVEIHVCMGVLIVNVGILIWDPFGSGVTVGTAGEGQVVCRLFLKVSE